MRLTRPFAVFGYHVTGSTGTLFLYGIVVGALALLGLSLLLAGIRRQPSPPLTWPMSRLATGGGQCRAGANEIETEPEPGQHEARDTGVRYW